MFVCIGLCCINACTCNEVYYMYIYAVKYFNIIPFTHILPLCCLCMSYTPLLLCCSPLLFLSSFLFLQALYPPLLFAYPFLPSFLPFFLSSIYNVYSVFVYSGVPITSSAYRVSRLLPCNRSSFIIFIPTYTLLLFEKMSNMFVKLNGRK